MAEHSDYLAQGARPTLIADRCRRAQHPSRTATLRETQLEPYLRRYHRQCWPAWAIDRGRANATEPWLSADDIAAHLGVTKDTVYTWIAVKAMPAHKVGRLWKFQASEIDNWVRAGAVAS